MSHNVYYVNFLGQVVICVDAHCAYVYEDSYLSPIYYHMVVLCPYFIRDIPVGVDVPRVYEYHQLYAPYAPLMPLGIGYTE